MLSFTQRSQIREIHYQILWHIEIQYGKFQYQRLYLKGTWSIFYTVSVTY